MEHQKLEELVSAYVDGQLSPRERETVERHLSACEGCRALAAELAGVNAKLATLDPISPAALRLSAVIRRKVVANMRNPREGRSWLPRNKPLRYLGAVVVTLVVVAAFAVAFDFTFRGLQTGANPTPTPTPNPISMGYNSVDGQGQSTGDMLTLADRMAFWDVPGVSIALIRDSKIVWTEGFGIADGETKQPVRTDTLFSAGEVSQGLTAMGVMALVQKGVLDLDRNVNDYLVSWKVPENQFTVKEKVTLRRLLDGTSGLSIDGPSDGTVYLRGEPVPTIKQHLAGEPPSKMHGVHVVRTPGSQFDPSAVGFDVVQQLLEDVTGKPFAQYMQETVLGPLGMAHSTFEQPLPQKWWDQAAAWHAAGQQTMDGKWGVFPFQAAGGLWSTPSDLATLAIDIMQAYRGQSSKVLSRESVQKMLTPQVQIPNTTNAMGLGFVTDAQGNTTFLQTGLLAVRYKRSGSNYYTNFGFFAYLLGSADTGRGGVIMMNTYQPELLREILLRTYVEENLPGNRMSITVTVKDGEGNPVADAIVSSSAEPYRQQALLDKTGPDGTVTFANVCVGTYGFQAYKGSTSAPGQRLTLEPGTNGELTLVLRED